MIRGEFDASAAADPEALLAEYRSVLRETVDRVGSEAVAERAGLSEDHVDDAWGEAVGDLSLTDAAAILAADPDRPDADAIAAEARDILLLGMTTAVVDVDTLASQMDGALEPKELQQKVEGRAPMTLAEYARIHHELRAHTE